MEKTKKGIANKFREIRDSLDDFKHVINMREIRELADLVDKKLEWILNILIIYFDDEKYKGMKLEINGIPTRCINCDCDAIHESDEYPNTYYCESCDAIYKDGIWYDETGNQIDLW